MTYSTEPPFPDFPSHSSHRQNQKVDPNGYKIVSVRLRGAEFEAFSDQVRTLGLTNNMALRIIARRVGGFLEIEDKTRQQLEAAIRAIGNISRNITMLNDNYAQSEVVDMQEFSACRAAFGQEFAQLDALLRTILNVSLRRIDGRFLMKEAATR